MGTHRGIPCADQKRAEKTAEELQLAADTLDAGAVAVLAARFADRMRGWPATAAVLGVLVLTGGMLWIFWWA